MNQKQCELEGGVWLNGICLTKVELDCRKAGGRWDGTRCIPAEETQCLNNCGIWENGICTPPIFAYDCTNEVEKLSPGQFAIGFDSIPENAKKINIHYTPENLRSRVYEGIKVSFPIPITISGQKPGITVVWYVEAVNEWGKKVGYSNEVTTITKI